MLFKVGELAGRTGMTVRALHHYDAIGLLSPNHRNSSGVRLYGSEEVILLHRIQAMKVLGYSLADIRAALAGGDADLVTVTRGHVRALEARAHQAQALADGLNGLLQQFSEGHTPTQEEWLDSMEIMALYQRHLTPMEIDNLRHPTRGEQRALEIQWKALVAEVNKAIKSKWLMDDHRVHDLAWRWVQLVIARTNDNPQLAIKLNQLHQTESRAQAIAGVGPVMLAWVGNAIAHARTAVFARYLTSEQTERLRQRQIAIGMDLDRWPKLMAQVQECLDAKLPFDSACTQELANTWQALFRESYCGDDAETESRIRTAFANEPNLTMGVGVNDALMAYMHKAIAHVNRSNSRKK